VEPDLPEVLSERFFAVLEGVEPLELDLTLLPPTEDPLLRGAMLPRRAEREPNELEDRLPVLVKSHPAAARSMGRIRVRGGTRFRAVEKAEALREIASS
jgi:hypothetical protein